MSNENIISYKCPTKHCQFIEDPLCQFEYDPIETCILLTCIKIICQQLPYFWNFLMTKRSILFMLFINTKFYDKSYWHCDEHLLYFSRFSDLLALADDIEADFKSVRVLRGVPARKAANASAAMGLDNRNSRKTTKKVVQETSGSSDSSDVSITIIIRVLPKPVGLMFRKVNYMNSGQAIVNYWSGCCTRLRNAVELTCIDHEHWYLKNNGCVRWVSNPNGCLSKWVSNPNCFSMFMYYFTFISPIFG